MTCKANNRIIVLRRDGEILRTHLFNAFRRVFGDVTVIGCWFLFAQSVIKRVHKLGLKDEYMNEPDVQD